MFLSAAMMLEWIGERHKVSSCIEAAEVLQRAIARCFAEKQILPFEFGGNSGTDEITKAVIQSLPNQK
jgi:3-isopropylmalate dehydrogenase